MGTSRQPIGEKRIQAIVKISTDDVFRSPVYSSGRRLRVVWAPSEGLRR